MSNSDKSNSSSAGGSSPSSIDSSPVPTPPHSPRAGNLNMVTPPPAVDPMFVTPDVRPSGEIPAAPRPKRKKHAKSHKRNLKFVENEHERRRDHHHKRGPGGGAGGGIAV